MLTCREDNILLKERSIIYIYGSGSVIMEKVVSNGSDLRCSNVKIFIMTVDLPEFK